MKKGDIVKIRDSSYIAVIEGAQLRYENCNSYYKNTDYIVVETDLSLPGKGSSGRKEYNEVILRERHGDKIVFIMERFLEYITCPTCRRTD